MCTLDLYVTYMFHEKPLLVLLKHETLVSRVNDGRVEELEV